MNFLPQKRMQINRTFRKVEKSSHYTQRDILIYSCAYIFRIRYIDIDIDTDILIDIDIDAGPSGRGLRRGSAAARLLRLWVRIPPGAWIFVCCEFYVLSGRGLCDELITCPEESYRLWCVVVCDLETS